MMSDSRRGKKREKEFRRTRGGGVRGGSGTSIKREMGRRQVRSQEKQTLSTPPPPPRQKSKRVNLALFFFSSFFCSDGKRSSLMFIFLVLGSLLVSLFVCFFSWFLEDAFFLFFVFSLCRLGSCSCSEPQCDAVRLRIPGRWPGTEPSPRRSAPSASPSGGRPAPWRK